ncbi:MAG: hypothetical protein KGV44_04625, partial [Flavobacteriaceae bacterium]|nr:hypothetical protein [Flavobacteriaceae bacterium]
MKKLLLYSFLLIGFSTSVFAQKKFKIREPKNATPLFDGKVYHLKGNFTMLGNTNMTMYGYDGSITSDPHSDMDNANKLSVFVDVDNDNATVNSSKAQLVFPSAQGKQELNPDCSQIVWAGLYWCGRAEWDSDVPVSDEVDLRRFREGTLRVSPDGSFTFEPSQYFVPPAGKTEISFKLPYTVTNNDGTTATSEIEIVSGTNRHQVWALEDFVVVEKDANGAPVPGFPNIKQGKRVNISLKHNDYSWQGHSMEIGGERGAGTNLKLLRGLRTVINGRRSTDLPLNSEQFIYWNNGTTPIGRVYVKSDGTGWVQPYSNFGRTKGANPQAELDQAQMFEYYEHCSNGTKEPAKLFVFVKEGNGGNDIYLPSNMHKGTNVENRFHANKVFKGKTGATIRGNILANDNIEGGIASFKVFNTEITANNTLVGYDVTLSKKTVLLKGPGALDYTPIVASEDDIYYSGVGQYDEKVNGRHKYFNNYLGYADVTDYVKDKQKGGMGMYTVANIALREGKGDAGGYYGAWTMVVVYKNDLMVWKDIAIYDGYQFVKAENSGAVVRIDGFRTPPKNEVNMEIGLFAGEGDRNILKDYLELELRESGNYEKLNYLSVSHTASSEDNFFNSTVNIPGSRVPELPNNTGIDVTMFKLKNTGNKFIDNNQPTTSFRLGSAQDAYMMNMIAMSVDAYTPELVGEDAAFETTEAAEQDGTPKTEIEPGKEGVFSIKVYNRGSEPITNAVMYIPIPTTVSDVNDIKFTTGTATLEDGYEIPGLTRTVPELGGLEIKIPPIPIPGGRYIKWVLTQHDDIPNQPAGLPQSLPNGTPTKVLAKLSYKVKATEDCFILRGQNKGCVPEGVISQGFIRGQGVKSYKWMKNLTTIDKLGFNKNVCPQDYIAKPTKMVFKIPDDYVMNCPQEPVNQEVCLGEKTQKAVMKFAGITKGKYTVQYDWTVDNTAIGFSSAKGSGDILPFTPTAVGEATITVIPKKMLDYQKDEQTGEYLYDSNGNFILDYCYGNPYHFTITVKDTPKPTVTQATQEFCETDNPKIKNLQATGTNIKWYDAERGGNLLDDPETPLTNGKVYWASQTPDTPADGSKVCESSTRTKVTVVIHKKPTIAVVQPAPICSTATIDLATKVSVANGVQGTFHYYTTKDANSGALSNEITGEALKVNTAGKYYVQFVPNNANACPSDAMPITVGVNKQPVVKVKDIKICLTHSAGSSQLVPIDLSEALAEKLTGGQYKYYYNSGQPGYPNYDELSSENVKAEIYEGGGREANTKYYVKYIDAKGCESEYVNIRIVTESEIMHFGVEKTSDYNGCKKHSYVDASYPFIPNVNSTYPFTEGGTTKNEGFGGSIVTSSLESYLNHGNKEFILNTLDASGQNIVSSKVVYTSVHDPSVHDLGTTYLTCNGVYIIGGQNSNYTLATDLPAGKYSVTYRVISTGCSETSEVITIENKTPAMPDAPTLATAGKNSVVECAKNPIQTLTAVGLVTPPTGSEIVWYTTENGDETTTTPTLNEVATKTYYAVSRIIGGECESTTRTPITLTINDSTTPALQPNANTTFCKVDNKKISDLKALVNGTDVKIYATKTSTDVLGDDVVLEGKSYFATQTVTGNCESSVRLEIPVTVNDSTTPALQPNANTTFCKVDNKKISDLKALVNGTDVKIYATKTSTDVLGDDVVLEGKSYFATQTVTGNCESSVRLEIPVTVNDSTTPALQPNANTTFCKVDNKKISDLKALVNGTDVKIYATKTSTDVLGDDVVLEGKSYFATQTVTGNCESSVRLEIPVTVNDSTTPALQPNANTTFCKVDNKKISDLKALVNGTDVKIYATKTSTDVLGDDVVLEGKSYFATQTVTGNCESSVRLEIPVTVNDNPTLPTITKATPTNAECNGTGTATIEGGLIAGLTYTLSELDTSGAVVGTPKTLTNATITGLKFNTDYKVTVTNANNCSVETTGNDIINISDGDLDCDGDGVKKKDEPTPEDDTKPCTPYQTPKPVVNDIATDNKVSLAEKTAGVTITGTAETGIPANPDPAVKAEVLNAEIEITVTWGGKTKTTTVANGGTWTVTFPTADIPADGNTTVSVTAKHHNCTSEAQTKPVKVDTEKVPAPHIYITQDAGEDGDYVAYESDDPTFTPKKGDTNENDGFVNKNEMGTADKVKVRVTFDKTKVEEGDIVTIVDKTNNPATPPTITRKLTKEEAEQGYIDAEIDKPTAGSYIVVETTITDTAGNVSEMDSDKAKLDTSELEIAIEIIDDTDNNELLSKSELKTDGISVKVKLVKGAVAGDRLSVSGTGNNDINAGGDTDKNGNPILSQADIDRGYVMVKFPKIPAEGTEFKTTAVLSDSAGNKSNKPEDKATIDATAPPAPAIEITEDNNPSDGIINKAE